MANTVHFRRALCRAADAIGFESQVNLYLMPGGAGIGTDLELRKLTTANVALVDGMLAADFHLNDDLFAEPDEIVVTSLLSTGPAEAGMTFGGTAIQINGIVISRRWPADTP